MYLQQNKFNKEKVEDLIKFPFSEQNHLYYYTDWTKKLKIDSKRVGA